MAFVPPTLTTMRAVVLRALRDTNGDVFKPDQIDDFIKEALSDLSGYRAKETTQVAGWPLVLDPAPFSEFIDVWKVQFRITKDLTSILLITVPSAGSGAYDARAGWDFYGHQISLPALWVNRFNAYVAQGYAGELVVSGYIDRVLPDDPADVLDLDENADYVCVLAHAKYLGFEVLNHDRSLYQQWIAATNNTDVSPTQLSGMQAQAEQTFARARSRNMRLRRVPAGDSAYAF